mmetsp:Transcript_17402/g.52518  ORF Transcript_17402/g.52518 Transcript_17402/m.52518 type:complete len:339 (+) Transcript_17402:1219-2235(+)
MGELPSSDEVVVEAYGRWLAGWRLAVVLGGHRRDRRRAPSVVASTAGLPDPQVQLRASVEGGLVRAVRHGDGHRPRRRLAPLLRRLDSGLRRGLRCRMGARRRLPRSPALEIRDAVGGGRRTALHGGAPARRNSARCRILWSSPHRGDDQRSRADGSGLGPRRDRGLAACRRGWRRDLWGALATPVHEPDAEVPLLQLVTQLGYFPVLACQLLLVVGPRSQQRTSARLAARGRRALAVVQAAAGRPPRQSAPNLATALLGAQASTRGKWRGGGKRRRGVAQRNGHQQPMRPRRRWSCSALIAHTVLGHPQRRQRSRGGRWRHEGHRRRRHSLRIVTRR